MWDLLPFYNYKIIYDFEYKDMNELPKKYVIKKNKNIIYEYITIEEYITNN
ncbi:hypothetical protein MYSEV_028 [Mythimna separata entomopoxvirus 'L']|uniref:Uncharacterized protein n=1 Tax=Mythimna separata entomopoxvirus 'L' TaxID=1293572 RepID=A0A916KQC1_9POXV|nr:hypothetical protein MYSEV_028 [Mythimna separata entomopoxvirus 'L']CCU56226.1 hypothetical protein MYSEV_028 [Mythimna separata entomopoxvirus 'L']